MVDIYTICWIILVHTALNGLLLLSAVAVSGYLVFRTKREQHERIFPRNVKREHKPIVKDPFSEGMAFEEEGLPDIIKKQSERMAAELAVKHLKEVDRG